MKALALMAVGYVLGSIPTSQIAARLLKGIDLRRYGSGTVSGTSVYYHVASWAVVPVGVVDIMKAAVPTWLGLRLGLGEATAMAAGLAAIVGHCWPVFLRFQGGRGISPYLGLLLVILPWGFPWLLASMAIGRLFHVTAEGSLVGIATMPVISLLASRSATCTLACLCMLALTLVKRVEANRLPLPTDPAERRQVIWRRILMDRDVARGDEWVHGGPADPDTQPATPRRL